MFTDNQKKCLADVFRIKHSSENIDRKIYLSLKKLTEKSDDTKVTGSFKIVERMGDPIKYVNNFSGIIFSILYIEANHKNACVLFADELKKQIIAMKISGYSNFVTYNDENNDIHVPSYFLEKFRQGLDYHGCDFIIFPIFLFEKHRDNVSHYNMCIYNKREKSLERFEPKGSLYMGEFDLDERLRNFFDEKFPNVVNKYYAPIDTCPIAGFQKIQVDENATIDTDPLGFCLTWSVWYVDLRLFNPKKSQKQVIDFAIKTFKENKMELTEFIRGYNNALQIFIRDFIRNNITVDMIRKYGDVLLYSPAKCAMCTKVKKLLTKNGIKFTAITVMSDYKKFPVKDSEFFTTYAYITRITGKNNCSFPVIQIQRNIVLGDHSDLFAIFDKKDGL